MMSGNHFVLDEVDSCLESIIFINGNGFVTICIPHNRRDMTYNIQTGAAGAGISITNVSFVVLEFTSYL